MYIPVYMNFKKVVVQTSIKSGVNKTKRFTPNWECLLVFLYCHTTAPTVVSIF